MPEIYLVKIHFENFLLCELPFNLQSENRLKNFPHNRPGAGGKQTFRELLGDGRSSLHNLPRQNILNKGAKYCQGINADMMIKIPVLCGDEGIDQVPGEFLVGHEIPFFLKQLRDQFAVHIIKTRGDTRLELPEIIDTGEIFYFRCYETEEYPPEKAYNKQNNNRNFFNSPDCGIHFWTHSTNCFYLKNFYAQRQFIKKQNLLFP